jgi:hypothetical protein
MPQGWRVVWCCYCQRSEASEAGHRMATPAGTLRTAICWVVWWVDGAEGALEAWGAWCGGCTRGTHACMRFSRIWTGPSTIKGRKRCVQACVWCPRVLTKRAMAAAER